MPSGAHCFPDRRRPTDEFCRYRPTSQALARGGGCRRRHAVLSRRIVNDPAAFLELLEGVEGESKVALEATYGWEWLADLLEDAGYELHLAHPLRTRAIAAARVRTDAVDARTLAQLLRADLLPEAYIAPRELRDLRDLLRHRVALTQMRSALKNRVHALLAKHGILHGYADLFGKDGSEFLAALELREPPRRRLESLLGLISDFDREIEAASGEIDARAKHDPRVDVLCQIRGIGPYTAMLVIAEVGDISRFGSARKLCAWAGLTPTIRSSDGKARLGHITKQGSRPLRWMSWRGASRRVSVAAKLTVSRRPQPRCSTQLSTYTSGPFRPRCWTPPAARSTSSVWPPRRRRSGRGPSGGRAGSRPSRWRRRRAGDGSHASCRAAASMCGCAIPVRPMRCAAPSAGPRLTASMPLGWRCCSPRSSCPSAGCRPRTSSSSATSPACGLRSRAIACAGPSACTPCSCTRAFPAPA